MRRDDEERCACCDAVLDPSRVETCDTLCGTCERAGCDVAEAHCEVSPRVVVALLRASEPELFDQRSGRRAAAVQEDLR